MEFNSKLTKEICEVYGPTGRESKVAEYIQNQLKEVKCTINYDPIFLTLIV